MIGTEPLDREPAEDTGAAERDRLVYRDRLGVVSEGRPMSRPALLAAVVAVCGTGLLAGLGLFGGTTPKARPAAPAAAVVQDADPAGARAGGPVPEQPVRRVHTHHVMKHAPHSLHAVHEAARRAHKTAKTYKKSAAKKSATHKGSAGSGAPHSAGRHSPLRGRLRPAEPPATAPHAAPSGTPRTAPRPTSAATGPAASR